jgi:hypothetical protein
MVKKPFSKQRWRFFDLGLFMHIAMRVAEDVGTVEYFTPWVSAFAKPHQTRLGEGLPGVTRIQHFFEGIDEVDVFVFPDVGFGDLQDDLRRRGKAVYGCGFAAEMLEADRFHLRKVLAQRGLPVAPHKKIVGMSALYDYLEKHPDVWVKLNNDSRGIKETFHVKTLPLAFSTLTKMSADLDCFREQQLFLVEEPVFPGDKGVEMGDDWSFAGGKFLEVGCYGPEVKGDGYGGRFMEYGKLPAPVRVVTDAMRPVFAKSGCGSARSSEIRFGKVNGKLTGYFGDACQRFGCPPSGVLVRGYKNITEVMYSMATGEPVRPVPVKEYCAEIILSSSSANDEAVALEIKDKNLSRVLPRQFYKNDVDGLYYRIPQKDGSLVAEAIGFGDSLEEAQQEARESVELIDFVGKDWSKDVFERMDENLEKADKLGIGLGGPK